MTPLSCNKPNHSALQDRGVLRCKTACFALRNDPFCSLKWHVLKTV